MSMNNDNNVQHGIDDNPNNDAEKGAALGGLGGVAVGAAAGSMLGPVGTVIGAVAGGLLGAGASGAAVAAIDQVDNDNTVSGVGDGVTSDLDNPVYDETRTDTTGNDGYQNATTGYGAAYDPITTTDLSATPSAEISGHNVVTGQPATSDAGTTGLAVGAVAGGLVGTVVGGPVGAAVGGTLGSLAGGVAGDAAEAADSEGGEYIGTPLGDPDSFRNDENLGFSNYGGADLNADTPAIGGIDNTSGVRTNGITDGIGNDVPGIQTGGITTEGSDTRGITEKATDAFTGDRTDDKTGGRVL
jgi:uncharacterized protein YcfJ